MLKEELNSIATIKDLEDLRLKLLSDFKKLLHGKNPEKKFFSPKEFSAISGEKYSTVINKCKTGRLKARQDGPGCLWQICASELERYKSEIY